MGVRQYIGARYVPKFYEGSNGSAWDEGVVYEPLVIVSYLNNYFTSKKTVPATVGAPNLNPEYWANIGLLGDLENRMTQAEGDIDSLEGRMDTAEEDIEDLQDATRKKKYLFVGDSYAAGYSPDGDVTGWPSLVASNLGLGNGDYDVIAVSGSGISNQHTNEYYLPYIIQQAEIEDADSFTDVVVCCGRNDIGSGVVSGLEAGFSALHSVVASKFKNAVLRIGFIGSDFNLSEFSQTKGAELHSALMIYCKERFYLAGVENILANKTLMSSDGKHPNQSGQDLLGVFIANAIMSGGCSVAYGGHEISASIVTGATGVCTWAEKVKDGFTTVYPCYGGTVITFGTAVAHTFDLSHTIKICDNIQFNYYVPIGGSQSRFPVIAQFNFDDSTYLTLPCWLDVNPVSAGVNEVTLGAIGITAAGDNYITKNISQISLTELSTVNKYWIG